jgi:hypothetical protein
LFDLIPFSKVHASQRDFRFQIPPASPGRIANMSQRHPGAPVLQSSTDGETVMAGRDLESRIVLNNDGQNPAPKREYRGPTWS